MLIRFILLSVYFLGRGYLGRTPSGAALFDPYTAYQWVCWHLQGLHAHMQRRFRRLYPMEGLPGCSFCLLRWGRAWEMAKTKMCLASPGQGHQGPSIRGSSPLWSLSAQWLCSPLAAQHPCLGQDSWLFPIIVLTVLISPPTPFPKGSAPKISQRETLDAFLRSF